MLELLRTFLNSSVGVPEDFHEIVASLPDNL